MWSAGLESSPVTKGDGGSEKGQLLTATCHLSRDVVFAGRGLSGGKKTSGENADRQNLPSPARWTHSPPHHHHSCSVATQTHTTCPLKALQLWSYLYILLIAALFVRSVSFCKLSTISSRSRCITGGSNCARFDTYLPSQSGNTNTLIFWTFSLPFAYIS